MKRLRTAGFYTVWLAFLLIVLVMGDVLVGLLYERYAPSYGHRNLQILLGELDAYKALNERPHPYLLWENTPEYTSSNGIRQTNSLGYRNSADFSVAKEPRTFRILALGGSTTYGYMLDDPDDAWPGQLESLLNGRLRDSAHGPFDHVEVINGGLNYATSAELLLHYLYRDRYLNPDLVIVHTGGNDVHPLLFDDYTPEYVHFRPGWATSLHRLRKGEATVIGHSNVAKLLYAFWLNDSVALPHVIKHAKPFDLPEDYYIRNATKNEPIGFERNLDLLLRNIVDDGAKPIVFPFVSASDEQLNALSPEAAKLAYSPTMRKGDRIGFKKHVRIMQRLAQKFHATYVQLPSTQIPIEYYLDQTHLSKQGEAIKAAFLADHVSTMDAWRSR